MLGELRDEQGRVLYRLRGAVVDDGTERAVFQQGVVRGNVMEANTAKIVGHFFGTWVAGSGDGSFRADIRSTLEAKAPIGALVGRFRVPQASLETEKAIASPTKKQDPADQAKKSDPADQANKADVAPGSGEKAIASPTKKQDPADQAKNADVAPGAVAIQILPDPTPKGALIMKWQLDHAL